MRTSRSGISTVLAAAFVIVIVVAAGAVYFVALPSLSSGSSKSSSSTTSSSSSSSASASSSTSSSSAITSTSSTTVSSSSSSPTTSTSSTSSSSTSSSATSSASTSTTTTTCSTSTSSNTGSSSGQLANFTIFFVTFSQMKVHYSGTFNGSSYDLTTNYTVTSTTSTKINLDITTISGGSVTQYSAVTWRNGTVESITFNGYTITGSSASGVYFGAMSAFFFEQTFTNQAALSEFTNTNFVTQSGPTIIMIGSSSVSATNYTAKSLPLDIQYCGGSANFNKFTIQTGVASGTSLTLLTYFTISGQITSGSDTQNVDLTLQVTSLTKA